MTLEALASSWEHLQNRLAWSSVFVLPVWLKAWWQEFAGDAALLLCEVRDGDDPIGIAPLKVSGGEASFIGSSEVCDYMDFVIAPGREPEFFRCMLDHLEREGISVLTLESLRQDSTVMTTLADIAGEQGWHLSRERDGVSFDLELPSTWEAYMRMLTTKQGREVRRKLRRLDEAGDVQFRTCGDAGPMDVFLKLLRQSREDKADFMTAKMESFFRCAAEAMAGAGLLRFGVLELNGVPVAAVLCFDYNDTVYLYNSGYDPEYGSLSAGLLSKVLSIKDSIDGRKKRYDFLKGSEVYKRHLGGREIPLYSCRIASG